MIDFIYIFLFISASCLSGGLLGLLVNHKTGSEKGIGRSRRVIGLSLFLLFASLLAILLNAHGLLENKWVHASSLLGGMILLTVSAVPGLKHEPLRGPKYWIWVSIGYIGMVLFFLGVEILVTLLFAEGIPGGLFMCAVLGAGIWALGYTPSCDRKQQEKREARQKDSDQLEARVFASIVETGKAPTDIPWDELEPILHKLSKQQAEAVPEESRKAAYEQFLSQNLPEKEQPTDNIQE